MGAFLDAVDRGIADYWDKAAAVARETILTAGALAVHNSPVGEPSTWKGKPPKDYKPGQFRSNWNLGVDSVDRSHTSRTDVVTVNGLGSLPDRPFGHRIYISNASPQAFRIEIDHWSRQAPNGVVTPIEGEFMELFRKAVLKVRSGSHLGPGER